jgi:phenylalanyl-tRNA synthetase beta chain
LQIQKALVIAGVMGSIDAEVDDQPWTLFLRLLGSNLEILEVPPDDLGLHTDSSQRFARDVDPSGIDFGARRAIDLILEIAGGECIPEVISLGSAPRGESNY